MADATSMPAEASAEAPSTEVTNTNTNTNTNTTSTPEVPQAGPQEPTGQSTVDLHGLDPNQLGDIARFLKGQGGFEALKKRISEPASSPQVQPTPEQPAQPAQPQAQPNQPTELPEGYASLQELQVKGYFKELSKDPKYGAIADQIANGDILKEMAQMGMMPVDDNYNINVAQLDKFLTLKAASVPAKPASAPVGTAPTAEYMEVGENITSKEEALQVLRQSVDLESRGVPPHPAKQKAEEYLKNNWGK